MDFRKKIIEKFGENKNSGYFQKLLYVALQKFQALY